MKKIILCILIISIFSSKCFSIGGDYIWSTQIISPEIEIRPADQIVFRVTLINRDNEKWKKEEYFLKAEIFSEKKLFLTETLPAYGNEELQKDEMTSIDIYFNIPRNYAGLYFYRISLYRKEKLLYRTDYYFFNVVSSETLEEKIKQQEKEIKQEKEVKKEKEEKYKIEKYKLQGYYNLHYQTSSYKKQNYLYYNLSANLNTEKNSYKFFLNSSYVNKKFVTNRYLLEYKRENFTLSIGDSFLNVLPSGIYSTISLLSGCGVEGVQLNYKKEKYSCTIWGGKNISAKEENFSGINISYEFKNKNFLSLSYILLEEEKKNEIERIGISLSPSKNLFFNLEGAISNSENKKNAKYYSLEAVGTPGNIYWTASKKWVEKDFVKIGTTSFNPEEEFLINYQISPELLISLNFNKEKEYQSAPAEEPLIYKRISLETSWTILNFPRMRLGYEERSEESKDYFSPKDTLSRIWTIGSDTNIKNFFLSLNIQKSSKVDTVTEDSSKAVVVYFHTRGEIIPGLPFSFSYNFQKENKYEISQKYLTNTFTFNITPQLPYKRKKIKLNFDTNISLIKSPSSSKIYSYNFSLNYKIGEKINVEIGAGQEFYKNMFNYTKNIFFLKHNLIF